MNTPEILDLNAAYDFHSEEVQASIDYSFYEVMTTEQKNEHGGILPVEFLVDPKTASNHLAIMSWILDLVSKKHTTSFTFYANKCKELSIPPYTQE
jgi:hypothetical protein